MSFCFLFFVVQKKRFSSSKINLFTVDCCVFLDDQICFACSRFALHRFFLLPSQDATWSNTEATSIFVDLYVAERHFFNRLKTTSSAFLDEDDTYQYRHVILDKEAVSLIPKNRLLEECEWRTLGIKQGPHWEHYLIHKPGKIPC